MGDSIGLNSITIPALTLEPLRALIQEAGLDDPLFDDGNTSAIRLADYFRLRERIALALGNETVHLSSRPLIVGTSDLVHERLGGTGTVREMLETLAQSYNVVHGGDFNRVRLARSEIIYIVDDRNFQYAISRDDPFILFSLESLLVYVHLLVQSSCVTTEPLPIHSLRTRRKNGTSPLATWGIPIAHGSERFELRYDRQIGEWPVDPNSCPILGSRTVYGGISKALDRLEAVDGGEGGIVERASHALGDGITSQHAIAMQLGMSVATLRRRLAERGTNFRALRAETLSEIAIARLSHGANIADVAEELGYSDARSFARAFRDWTGRSPREQRDSRHLD